MNIEENDFVVAGPRGRRPPRLRAHRREPPRLPRIRAHRLRARSSARSPRSTIADRSPSSRSRRPLSRAGLSNDLAIWRNLWDDGADLAGHAHRFIYDGAARRPCCVDSARLVTALDALGVARRSRWRDNGSRALLGIAGNPGAGKSTLVEQLLSRIAAIKGPDWVAHVPDGRLPPRRRPAATGSARAPARVPRTRSTRSAMRTCSSGWSGRPRPDLRAGLRPDARATAGRGARGVARGPTGDHRGQLPAARRPARGLGRAPRWTRCGSSHRRRPCASSGSSSVTSEFGKTPIEARAWVAGTDQRNSDLVSPHRSARRPRHRQRCAGVGRRRLISR